MNSPRKLISDKILRDIYIYTITHLVFPVILIILIYIYKCNTQYVMLYILFINTIQRECTQEYLHGSVVAYISHKYRLFLFV